MAVPPPRPTARPLPLLLLAAAAMLSSGCRPDAETVAAADGSAAVAGAPEIAAPANDTPAGQRIEADVRALADDAMEGRETGTPGYDRAAEYVARRYAEIGLLPAGDDGSFFQRVPLIATTRVAEGARLAVHRNGRTIELQYLDQYLPAASAEHAQAAIEAPAVFVVHGIDAPHLGHDDFAGLDLRGKIAVLLPDTPEGFSHDMRAYYSSQQAKAAALAARGAIGVVLVFTPTMAARVPWDMLRSTAGKPDMALVDEHGNVVDGHPSLQAAAVVSVTAADLLFADAEQPAAELFELARQGKARGFELPGTISLATRSRIERLETRNVVGRLPGGDAALAAEHIVYTAHLDHVGVGEAVEGDAVYNGALDNALGVAIMLEAAQELAAAQAAPGRSALFVAVGAEEQGLLGSRWFALRPTVPAKSLVANINMDMPMLTAPTSDVVPVGVEHSTLQAALEQAAEDIGVGLSEDPFPEEVVFVRSDQFSFVRAGIPAVYLMGGVVGANPDQDPQRAAAWFLRNCYHKPCDQADLPIHYGDAARLARLNARIGRIVGDAPERPRWNADSFFGQTFGKRSPAPGAGAQPGGGAPAGAPIAPRRTSPTDG